VFGVGIIISVIVLVLTNPLTTSPAHKIPSVNSVDLSKVSINQSEAETAARDDLDKRAQVNGEQAGVYRGGILGSADLIYVDKDGTNYIVDRDSGRLGENLPFPIDSSKPTEYIWKITLNLGNTTKQEYIYAIDGNNGTAWMIGVLD
jgi:hypothetical protein